MTNLRDIDKITDVKELLRMYREKDFDAFKSSKELEQMERENAIMFVPRLPNPKQGAMLEAWLVHYLKVFAYLGGNRSAKTTTGIWLTMATMFGHYPWDTSKVLAFPHKAARKIRIVGQDWEKHIKTVIEPKLFEWWPKSRPVKRKKNNVGVNALWTDVITGSTIELMSNFQDASLFEGWDGDLVYYDEPPKRDVRVACARGLVDRQGREFFGMTLLKEAWVSREVIKARNPDGTVDDTVFTIEATIYDNLGYGVTQEGIDQFAKTLNEDEKEARLYGKPSFLSGLVWPQFDRDTHIKKRFDVPMDWMVDVQIDFHPAKPWAVSFMATSPVGFKYVVDEIQIKCNPSVLVDTVVRLIRDRHYRVESFIQVDPLAKGDSVHDFTVYDKLSDKFAAYNYILAIGSKNKDSGIAMTRDLLLTENRMPALFFFHDCVRTIEQVENYTFDPDTHLPEKDDDDFTECLYRNVLRGTIWQELEDPDDYPKPRAGGQKSFSAAGY